MLMLNPSTSVVVLAGEIFSVKPCGVVRDIDNVHVFVDRMPMVE